MATVSRQIEDDYGQISLSDIWSEKEKKWCFEPCLNFEGIEFWDNSDYVFKFFCGLKKNKKELKEFCKENKLDYTYTQETLLEIFKTSKKLGWWKNHIKERKLLKNGDKH